MPNSRPRVGRRSRHSGRISYSIVSSVVRFRGSLCPSIAIKGKTTVKVPDTINLIVVNDITSIVGRRRCGNSSNSAKQCEGRRGCGVR